MKDVDNIKINKKYYIKLFATSLISLLAALVFFFILIAVNSGKTGSIAGFAVYLVLWAFFTIVGTLGWILWLMFFKYSFNEDYIVAHQGVISRQERHLPYVVMQDVMVKQGIIDRILGLATIVVENASFGGAMAPVNSGSYYGYGKNGAANQTLTMGMHGNMFVLSGITLADAEKLRTWLLNKSTAVVGKQEGQVL